MDPTGSGSGGLPERGGTGLPLNVYVSLGAKILPSLFLHLTDNMPKIEVSLTGPACYDRVVNCRTFIIRGLRCRRIFILRTVAAGEGKSNGIFSGSRNSHQG